MQGHTTEPRADRPMASNPDPRAVRTRTKLVDAYRDAVEGSEAADLSVASLTRRAGVHRSVFYQHFASVDDLAILLLRDLFELISTIDPVLRSEPDTTGRDVSRRAMTTIVSFVHERREAYAGLLGRDAPPRATQRIVAAFAEQTQVTLATMSVRPPDVDPHVAAAFLAHGVLGVVGRWIDDPEPSLTEEQLVDQLTRCFPAWLAADSPAGLA